MELIRSQQHLRDTSRIAKVGGWEIDFSGNTLRWTAETFRIHEVPEDKTPDVAEAINYYHPDDQQMVGDLVQQAIETGTDFDFHARLVTAKNNLKWVRAIGTVSSIDGEKVGLHGTIQDITERKQFEMQMESHRKALADTIEGTNAGTWSWNIVTGELALNERWAEILGLTLKELEPIDVNTWINNVHPDDLPHANAELEKLFAKKSNYYDVEFRQPHRDGSWVWVNARGKIVEWSDDDKPVQMSGTHIDITMRKRAEEALKESEQRFRNFFENSPSGISITTLDGKLHANQSYCKILGYTEQELENITWSEITHPDDNEKSDEVVQMLLSGKKSNARFEKRYLHKSGEVVWVDLSVHLQRDDEDNPKYFLTSIVDITKSKQAEADIRALQRRDEALLEYSPVCHMIVDLDFKLQYMSSSGYDMLKLEYDKNYYGKSYPFEFFPERFRANMLEKIRVVKETYQPAYMEGLASDSEGNDVWLDSSLIPVLDEDGKIEYLTVVSADTTQRKTSEVKIADALLEAESANNIKDQFIANISHEIRTPLNSILGFSDLLNKRLEQSISLNDQSLFGYIASSSNRLMRTVDSILNFSQLRSGEITMQPKKFDLTLVVKEVFEELEGIAASKQLKFNLVHAKNPHFITADQYSIRHSVMHLVDNALKYTHEGKVDVALGHRGKQLTVSVSDTGIGISEEYQQRIFEPYSQASEGFTKEYQGIGLGLSLVKRYCDLNHVKLEMESTEGVGTTFTMVFSEEMNHENG